MRPASSRIAVWCATLGSVVVGLIGWWAVAVATGEPEAWDAPMYWRVAYPVFALMAGSLGYVIDGAPWRWGAFMIGAQALIVIRDPFAPLMFVGLLALGVVMIPLAVAGYLGSYLRNRRNVS